MVNQGSMRSRGFTLTEVITALAITAAMLAAVAQALVGLGRTRQGGQQRTLAIQETANLMEAIQARSWNGASQNELAELQLSEAFQRMVPRARLSVKVTSIDEPVAARRIAIAITVADTVDRDTTLSSLTAWKYRQEGADK